MTVQAYQMIYPFIITLNFIGFFLVSLNRVMLGPFQSMQVKFLSHDTGLFSSFQEFET